MPDADTSRIGMIGWSRGGMMTYLYLTKTDRIKAVVIGAAPTDLFRMIENRPEMETQVFLQIIPNYSENIENELKSRSAIYWVDKLNKNTPILLLHGSSDWRVDPENSIEMTHKLYKVKHPFRFVFYKGGDHGLTEYANEKENLIKEWFDKYIKNCEQWPGPESHGY